MCTIYSTILYYLYTFLTRTRAFKAAMRFEPFEASIYFEVLCLLRFGLIPRKEIDFRVWAVIVVVASLELLPVLLFVSDVLIVDEPSKD